MNNDRTDVLIETLSADLEPVRPLPQPHWRALTWLGAVAAVAIGLTLTSDVQDVVFHMDTALESWVALAGATATAVLAVIAAFQLSLPDRASTWALLPLPAAVIWIGASGVGCLRAWFEPIPPGAALAPPAECLTIIIGLSVPLGALLFVMLRRGHSMQPRLTAAMAGLASAAAAASLLALVHPYESAVVDLAFHALAVLVVIAVGSMFGGRALAQESLTPA